MNDRDQRRYDRITRIQTFGRENAADFTNGSKAPPRFKNIDRHLTALDEARAGQSPARVSKETLLDALNLDFKNIARTARTIALEAPGFDALYRIPDHLTESALTAHADKLLLLLDDDDAPAADGGDTPEQKAAKAALRAKFTAYDMPEDFADSLRDDREALREANWHNQGETQGGVENTAAIGQILGMASVDVQVLNTVMHNKYARQPAKLKAWLSASRVERAPQREKKTTPVNGGSPGTGSPTPP